MDFFVAALILANLTCSLVAGFLFSFTVVVMPGIKNLNDREFVRAFQAMDGIIQKSQPLFVLVWLGSVVTLIATAATSAGRLDSTEYYLLLVATLAYLLGVQLPTFLINIPLNNRLQSLDVDAMDEAEHKAARTRFERRWNRWNAARTFVSCLVAALLIVLTLRY